MHPAASTIDDILSAAKENLSSSNLKLLAPDAGWRSRGDMDPQFTRPFRASIVARARFIEDLVVEQAGRGLTRLGSGQGWVKSTQRAV
ncbi:MAG: hypothetical protein QOC89_5451 [Paraburkholderia sp.]|nr:hypothetical protein [Paraburkholderia sp.]